MKTWQRWMGLAVLGVLAMAPLGCGDDDEKPAPEPTARIRVVHASPDAPAVDVYARGLDTPLFANAGYGQATQYASVPAGDYVIDLRAAGAAPTSAPAFSTGTLTLAGGDVVTAVAAGLLGSSAAADRFRVLALAEDFATQTPGQARVRIVHAGADAPAVAVDVGDDGSAEIASLGRFADTGATGVALPAGTALQVGIRLPENAGGARVTGFTIPALGSGAEYFVVATGLLSELPRDAAGFVLVAVPNGSEAAVVRQNPVVFALHAGPDAPPVDLGAGGAALATNLAFGELSGSIQVPPGAYPLDVYAAGGLGGGDAPVATVTTPELAAGERYLAVATGFLAAGEGEGAFQILFERDGFDVAGSEALVRVVHASPDAPVVDVGVIGEGGFSAVEPLSGLAFGSASDEAGVALPAGTYTLGVAAAGTTTPAATFGVPLTSGQKVFGVAAGALGGGDGREGFRLIAVDTSVFPWAAATIAPNA
ncbi:MAG: DUF4397 domain-containing protein [bacterium]